MFSRPDIRTLLSSMSEIAVSLIDDLPDTYWNGCLNEYRGIALRASRTPCVSLVPLLICRIVLSWIRHSVRSGRILDRLRRSPRYCSAAACGFGSAFVPVVYRTAIGMRKRGQRSTAECWPEKLNRPRAYAAAVLGQNPHFFCIRLSCYSMSASLHGRTNSRSATFSTSPRSRRTSPPPPRSRTRST